MQRSHFFTIFILMLSLTLGACTNSHIQSQADMRVEHINIQHRIDIANQLFKQGEYYESLTQWTILRGIQPKNPQYKNRIRVLKALIKRRLKNNLTIANAALIKNNLKEAEIYFLIALSLAPNHNTAIKELKNIEVIRAELRQDKRTKRLKEKQRLAQESISNENSTLIKKTEKQNENENENENEQESLFLEIGIKLFETKDWNGAIRETTKYLSANPTDKNAIHIVITSHLNLSKRFEDRGHIGPAIQHLEDSIALNKNTEHRKKLLYLKRKLSSSYYIEGIKVYRDNIDQAITYWKKAIETNPNNKKAIFRLKKSEKMKRNLSKIKPKK